MYVRYLLGTSETQRGVGMSLAENIGKAFQMANELTRKTEKQEKTIIKLRAQLRAKRKRIKKLGENRTMLHRCERMLEALTRLSWVEESCPALLDGSLDLLLSDLRGALDTKNHNG